MENEVEDLLRFFENELVIKVLQKITTRVYLFIFFRREIF